MTEPAELTASILLRLSSPDEDDRTGFATQEADSRALAARFGARVVAVRKDDGWSGVLRQRPGFLAWLEDGAAGVDFLISWRSDRISRGGIASVAPLVDLANGINPETGLPSHAHRPRVLTAVDGVDSAQPRWETIFSLHAETAKGERDATSVRMLTHRRENRQSGRAVGGRRPWAFNTDRNSDGPGSVRRPIPERADAIRWALEHLRKGGSKTAIVREWTARGLEPKGSAKARKAGRRTAWHVTPVTRILSNPNLYGATIDHGQLVRNDDGTARIDPGQAILTLPEFVELQALLAGRKTARDNPNRDDPTLLAGLLLCGSCGRTMYPHRPAGGRVWTYRCRGGVDCPTPVSVLMSAVEEYLVDEFHLSIGDVPQSVGGWVPDVTNADPVEVARLTEAIAEADKRLGADLEDEEALLVLRQRRDLRSRLAALQDEAATSAAMAEVRLREIPSSRTFSEAFHAAETVQERTKLLALVFERGVTVAPGKRGTFDPERLTW